MCWQKKNCKFYMQIPRHGFRLAGEFLLLEYFLRNKNRILTRTMISEKIWDIDFITESNIVDVYINFLRTKIDKGHDKKVIKRKLSDIFLGQKDVFRIEPLNNNLFCLYFFRGDRRHFLLVANASCRHSLCIFTHSCICAGFIEADFA